MCYTTVTLHRPLPINLTHLCYVYIRTVVTYRDKKMKTELAVWFLRPVLWMRTSCGGSRNSHVTSSFLIINLVLLQIAFRKINQLLVSWFPSARLYCYELFIAGHVHLKCLLGFVVSINNTTIGSMNFHSKFYDNHSMGLNYFIVQFIQSKIQHNCFFSGNEAVILRLVSWINSHLSDSFHRPRVVLHIR